MDRLYHLNIKQEEDDDQKEVPINNAQQQQNNEGHDASSCQLSVRAPKHVKKEEEGEDGIVKQVQPCTKVKKEEEGRECFKFEWDGDECDCEECRMDRQIKVEFNQNNATNNQQQANSSPGPSSETEKGVPSQSSVCKRVKKKEDGELIGQWDEDCDCDDCRRMRLKTIRLKQSNDMENRGAGGDDGEEKEIDEDGNGSEDVLMGNDVNMAVDNQIGDEDGDEVDQEGEQSGDGQERSEDQMSDDDDETEIDDEEYEMEVGGEESQTVRQSARHLKRKRTAEEIATECTTNPIQPNFAQPNGHLQCPHCFKSFDRNSLLQQHLRVHTGERPFHCYQCDKRFNVKSNLIKHQLIHQNIKRFRCDQCGKKFTQKVNFENHFRTHSGEQPFQCNFCEKSFARLNPRNRHEQAIHLHVKPYRCKQCGHTAAQRTAIIQHIRAVHFGLPKSIKQQRALNIIDNRDPRELVEKV